MFIFYISNKKFTPGLFSWNDTRGLLHPTVFHDAVIFGLLS